MKNKLDFRIGSRYPTKGDGGDAIFLGSIAKAELLWQELSDEQIASLGSIKKSTEAPIKIASPIFFPKYCTGAIVGIAHDKPLLDFESIKNSPLSFSLLITIIFYLSCPSNATTKHNNRGNYIF